MHGNNIRHKHAGKWELKAPKTKRVWKPNLRKIELKLDNRKRKIQVCMKCYKKIQNSYS